jgi:tetratricopeptide (TPR) repeat protein
MSTFILQHRESPENEISKILNDAKEAISNGESPVWEWSCGNTKRIEVGDRIFIQRTGEDPNGYFAFGIALAAVEECQLRLTEEKYSDLSEAYLTEFYGDSLMILIELHSVVDFDFPLEKKKLKAMPEFRGIFLDFRGGGSEIKQDSLTKVFYSEWEKHSMEFARKGFGIRLVDVWCDEGKEYKTQKEYQNAIDCFEQALIYDPEYVKAQNGIKSCNSIMERQSKVTSADSIVQENATVPTNHTVADNAETLVSETQSEAFFGNSENNRRVELAAIAFVTEFYEQEGWSVASVERDKVGYDLICKRSNERQNVEVKGTSGIQPQFIITANELKQGKEDRFFVLCVVFSALGNPTFERWTGIKMLEEFNFSPISYKARLKIL